ncbi:MAG: hypothetical protein K1X94_15805 [Sandaracinaceae bacterium]|nr:hypothetical protein [Sandaracinaceae bacterium]
MNLFALAHRVIPDLLADPFSATAMIAAAKSNYPDPIRSTLARGGFAYDLRSVYAAVDELDVMAFTLPPPMDSGHGYLFLLVVPRGEPGPVHYFVLERSLDIMTRKITTVIGSTTKASGYGHLNYGPGPTPTGDLATDAWALTQAVLPIVRSAR